MNNIEKHNKHLLDSKKVVLIKGDGKTIGDEIAIGNEHFYIMKMIQ